MDYEYPDYDLDLADYELGDYPYYADDYVTNEVTWTYQDLFIECVIPTLEQGVQIVAPLLLLCLAFRLVTFTGVPVLFIHFSAMIGGLCSMYMFFEMTMLYVVFLGIVGYLVLMVLHHNHIQNKGAIVAAVLLFLLVTWELWLTDPREWHKIRGSQMMLTMRIISLGIDMDRDTVKELPNPITYLGYCFFVGSIIFGPWISYEQYIQIEDTQDMNLSWLWKIIKSLISSLFCLLVSVCVSPALSGYYFANKWLGAYRDALSFRFSHYFVSFMSESCTTVAGLGCTVNAEQHNWDLHVAKPFSIEMPRSLVDVVTNWNIPMHNFLKNYIFKSTRSLGSFPAIILTYATSSILHGLNFQLAAVLLSLGVYSYTEYVFRKRLSEIFSACVLAKKCVPECAHRNKETSILVFIVNFCFGLLAVFHLAYLGVMFDSSSQTEEQGYTMDHTLSKWANLDYASHYVVLFTFVFYKLI
ncbi:porcupine-like protein [Saccoglossus kowalevskii]|uniref:Protein-serine O-palmitoleoyltransferase porcupine n=1 Tax=Saccoglossus kowalevskii TaxID=10224 RepID=D1LXB6_SACKO|nr:porcupine-like protein [Saccoglossus kowalevskii]ACY92622.1 porcupine-like protein [Saccoglossus kowalevskii]